MSRAPLAAVPDRPAPAFGRILMQVMDLSDSRNHDRRMRQEDLFYYLGRAEEELELALGAAHEAAHRAHALLAGYYFDLAYNRGEEPDQASSLAA
jgi:hypothetical protein